jgi:hypothetical protein
VSALSSISLLHCPGPIHLACRAEAESCFGFGEVHAEPVIHCPCLGEPDWLIVCDGPALTLVCRCGLRHPAPGVALQDLIALARVEPIRTEWASLDDALSDLGFTPQGPPAPRSRGWALLMRGVPKAVSGLHW